MSKVRLQHYIPQLILRSFTDSSGHLSCYRIKDEKFFHPKPNAVMASAWLYDEIELEEVKKGLKYLDRNNTIKKFDKAIKEMENENQYIEHSLGSSESGFGVLINNLITTRKGTILTKKSIRKNLLLMLRQLSCRSLRRKKQIESIPQERYNKCLKKYGLDDINFKNFASFLRFQELFIPSDEEKFEINYINFCGSISLAINDSETPLLFGNNAPMLKIPRTEEQLFPISPKLGIIIRRDESKSLIFRNKVDQYNNYYLNKQEIKISNILQSSDLNDIVIGPSEVIKEARKKHKSKY